MAHDQVIAVHLHGVATHLSLHAISSWFVFFRDVFQQELWNKMLVLSLGAIQGGRHRIEV